MGRIAIKKLAIQLGQAVIFGTHRVGRQDRNRMMALRHCLNYLVGLTQDTKCLRPWQDGGIP